MVLCRSLILIVPLGLWLIFVFAIFVYPALEAQHETDSLLRAFDNTPGNSIWEKF